MKKMSNKGFALVETLIVSIFVLGILTLLYTNIVPMMGEYEKRENYDNVNNAYKSYLIAKYIQNYTQSSYKCDNTISLLYDRENSSGSCAKFSGDPSYCTKLMKNLNVIRVYFTKYKNYNSTLPSSINDPETQEYIKSLGKFANKESSACGCRIIVKYEADIDVEQRQNNGEVAKKKAQFATIGVMK